MAFTLIDDLDYIPAVTADGGYMKSRQLNGSHPEFPQPRPQSYYADPAPVMEPQPIERRCTIDDIPMADILDFIDEHPLIRQAYQTDVRPYILLIIVLIVVVAFLMKKAFFSQPSSSLPELTI